MSELSEILYSRVVYLCSVVGISQNQLADSTGIPRNTLTNWSRSMPSLDKILRVAEYFDISYDYLLGHSDDPKSHKKPSTLKPHTKRLIIASEKLEYSSVVKETYNQLLFILNALVDENAEKTSFYPPEKENCDRS